jgi:hypothetical protein
MNAGSAFVADTKTPTWVFMVEFWILGRLAIGGHEWSIRAPSV